MANRNAARRYANAFFALCREQELMEAVHTDLTYLGALIKNSAELRDFVTEPYGIKEARAQTIHALLGKSILPLTERFVQFLNQKSRLDLLPLAIQEFSRLYHEHHNLARVTVASSVPLRDGQLTEISRRMAVRLGRRIAIANDVDPDLIGGLKIYVEDHVLDMSIEGQLQRVERILLHA